MQTTPPAGHSNKDEDKEQLLYAIDIAGDGFDERVLFERLKKLFQDLRRQGFWKPIKMAQLRGESESGENWEPVYPENELENSSKPDDPLAALFQLISTIACSLSDAGEKTLLISRESNHVDPVFRDCYYSAYARQHFNGLRFSSRLSFFAHSAPDDNMFSSLARTELQRESLQSSFIGCVVLNPTVSGAIGRLLINPKYLLPRKSGGSVFSESAIRLSEFKVTIQGVPLTVLAFPYRTQDGFMLRCVEVTIVDLVEYYSNEYGDYSMVLPSRIHAAEEEYLNERTLPAKGITYLTAAKLLSSFGFQARLHGIKHSAGERERFRRTFHHYLESGIPVAMNPADANGEMGHSLLCIGFSREKAGWSLGTAAYQFGDTSPHSEYFNYINGKSTETETIDGVLDKWSKTRKCNVHLLSDLPWRYIVIDDNQPAYQIRAFDQLSLYRKMENSVMLVALHKGIMLDARDAEDTTIHLLSDSRTGLFNWAEEYLERQQRNGSISGDVDIMLRLFLASSRRYKKVRTQQYNSEGDYLRTEMIGVAAMPHFLWVAEMYLVGAQKSGDRQLLPDRAFAEIVIDATHGKNRDIDGAVVLWNYPDRIAYRTLNNDTVVFDYYDPRCVPEQNRDKLLDRFRGIKPFDENLYFMRYQEGTTEWEYKPGEWFFCRGSM